MSGHLVIGGNGLIGTALCAELEKRGIDFLATTRREPPGPLVPRIRPHAGWMMPDGKLFFDLSADDPNVLPPAEVVYLVAAKPGFASCEGTAESWVVNVDAQIAIARRYQVTMLEWIKKEREFSESSPFIVYVSSDAVEWCGGTAYARQKAQVESYVQAIDGAIIRPTRVTGETVDSLAALMVDVGIGRKQGVHRWKP